MMLFRPILLALLVLALSGPAQAFGLVPASSRNVRPAGTFAPVAFSSWLSDLTLLALCPNRTFRVVL
jgi:hypothetical protein